MFTRIVGVVLLCGLLAVTGSSSIAQDELEFGVENVVTISQADNKKGSGRYREFWLDVAQGDMLSFDIKGKGGVDIKTSVEIYTRDSSYADYMPSSPISKLSWTTPRLPSRRIKVRILAYPPYGALGVLLQRKNDADPPAASLSADSAFRTSVAQQIPTTPQSNVGPSSAAPANSQAASQMSTAELMQRHRQLLQQLERITVDLGVIAMELASRSGK